jgi:hypothetical protein
MNQRIEAYLKQHYCRDYFNRYGETVEDDHYFMYREEVEGLIELIIQDVLNLFGDERISLHYLEQPCCEDAVTLLQSKIMDHFEVT